VRRAKQGVGQLLANQRDKGGWVFVTTSKEAGSPSKLSRVPTEMQRVRLDGDVVYLVNIAMNNL
jgi:hypothetical protein